ncbi:uncharacterized protein LOC110266879 [Arachis ipaensis]|uniref:uncharacterized protein LOC110266879 n=1 Tax=Arachis ipaensis TaxID=130454 RepID=UPI000A2B3E20|nr:uncharacterized protein LOC110266879 [Arachis ipaensis]
MAADSDGTAARAVEPPTATRIPSTTTVVAAAMEGQRCFLVTHPFPSSLFAASTATARDGFDNGDETGWSATRRTAAPRSAMVAAAMASPQWLPFVHLLSSCARAQQRRDREARRSSPSSVRRRHGGGATQYTGATSSPSLPLLRDQQCFHEERIEGRVCQIKEDGGPTLGDGGRRRWLPRSGSLSRISSLPVREFSGGKTERRGALPRPRSDDCGSETSTPAQVFLSSSLLPRLSLHFSLIFGFCSFPFMEKEERKPCAAVSDLCIYKMTGNLYQRIETECEAHISTALQSLVGQSPDLVVFLSLVERCWQDLCGQMLMIRGIALYLDRTYVKQTANVRSLWDMGLQLFN